MTIDIMWWLLAGPVVLYIAVRVGSTAYFHSKKQFVKEMQDHGI